MNIYKFFKNKKILVTGHTGFKGSWLVAILHLLNARVFGLSLNLKKNSHFKKLNLQKVNSTYFDIANFSSVHTYLRKIKPDIIFHLAAQSLVKESLKKPLRTWKTNVIGTLNLLESMKSLKNKCTAVIVTSDKCYLNLEKKSGYKENDSLGGKDPYSASKASAENVFLSYYQSFFREKKNIRIASARAGNVVGGGDWSNDRIIPDFYRSLLAKKKLILRNPGAIRPWQHVLELLFGYLKLAYKLGSKNNLNGKSFNFGPSSSSKYTVLDVLKNLKKKNYKINWKIKKSKKNEETKTLILNSKLSLKLLKWKTKLSFRKTIELTGDWYDDYIYNKKLITFDQIKNYIKIKQ